jgi:hypothetical protein
MNKEQLTGNKPSMGLAGLLTAAALILILLFATIIVGWRAKKNNKTPYSQKPTSNLYLPAGDTRIA